MNIIYLPTWATTIFIIAIVVLGILKCSSSVKNQQKGSGETEKEDLSKSSFSKFAGWPDWNWKTVYYVGASVVAILLGILFLLNSDLSNLRGYEDNQGYHSCIEGYYIWISLISAVAVLIIIYGFSSEYMHGYVRDAKKIWLFALLMWVFLIFLVTLLYCSVVCGIIWLVTVSILAAIAMLFK